MLIQYVIAYDISEPKRLQRVFKTLRDFGDPLQLSVFECQLSEKNYLVLRDRLNNIIDKEEDRVIFIRLGPVGEKTAESFEVMGCQFAPRDRKVHIV